MEMIRKTDTPSCHMAFLVLFAWLFAISTVQADERLNGRLQKYVSGAASHSQKFGEQGVAYLDNRNNINNIINAFIFDTYIAPDRMHLTSLYNQTLGSIEDRKVEILDSIVDTLAVVDGSIDILQSSVNAAKLGKPPSDLIYMAAARLSTTAVEISIPYELPSSTGMAVDALLVCVNSLETTPVFSNRDEVFAALQNCALEIYSSFVEVGVEAMLNTYFSKEISASFGSLTGDMVRIAGDCAFSANKGECAWSAISTGLVWGGELAFNTLALKEIKEEEIDLIIKLAVYELVELQVKFGLNSDNTIASDYLGMGAVEGQGLAGFYGPAIGKINELFDNGVAAAYARDISTGVGSFWFPSETIEDVFRDLYTETLSEFIAFKSDLSQLPPLLPEINAAPDEYGVGEIVTLTAKSLSYSPEPVSYEWYRDGEDIPFYTDTPLVGDPSQVELVSQAGRSTYNVVVRSSIGQTTTGVVTLTSSAGSEGSSSRPYLTVLCKFTEVGIDVQNAHQYFQDLFYEAPGGLNHYWKEVSGDRIDLVGSSVSGWFDMPNSANHYESLNKIDGQRALFDDCTNAAAGSVDFPTFEGINLVFNRNIDGGSGQGDSKTGQGGYMGATLGGVSRAWPVMFMYYGLNQYFPDRDFPSHDDTGGWAHEMGHTFGLSHSSTIPLWNILVYANSWSVMSRTPHTLPQHPNSYEKNKLGWIDSTELYSYESGTATIDIDPLHFQAATGGAVRAAIVTVGGDVDFYTVEVRQNGVNSGVYEEYLPGTGVIIHAVKESRSVPALLVSSDESSWQESEIWRVGEVFEDVPNGVKISILESTATGFKVKIESSGLASEPVSPEPLSPTTGETVDGNEPIVLSFREVAGADRYHVIVSNRAQDSWMYEEANILPVSCESGTCTAEVATFPEEEGSAAWQVRAHNNVGWGGYSEPVEFTVSWANNTPPDEVYTFLSPNNIIDDTTPTYAWNAVANASWYQLWVNDASGNIINRWYTESNLDCEGGGTCSVIPSEALAEGNVVWWVRTWNAYGYGPWSSAQSVTVSTITDLPGTVTIFYSPSAGETTSRTPTYRWAPATGASWYLLWVDDSTGNVIQKWFTAESLQCEANHCEAPASVLAPGSVTWWVRAWNVNGYAPWSDSQSFLVE